MVLWRSKATIKVFFDKNKIFLNNYTFILPKNLLDVKYAYQALKK